MCSLDSENGSNPRNQKLSLKEVSSEVLKLNQNVVVAVFNRNVLM